jgi:hypothetical protein
MNKLILIFDLSSSISGRIVGSMLTRLDWLKIEARNRIKQASVHGVKEFELYTLAREQMTNVPIYGSVMRCVDSLEAKTRASTRRWDAIGFHLMRDEEALSNATVLLFTDADADESRRYWQEDVEHFLCGYRQSTFELVAAPDEVSLGSLGISSNVDPNLYSPVVVDLVGRDSSLIRMVEDCVARAVTFVRDRTGLRYEPVTTVLIDQATIETHRSLGIDTTKADDQLLYDLCEMLRLLQGTCLVFHKFFQDNDPHYTKLDRSISEYLPSSLINFLDPHSNSRMKVETNFYVLEELGDNCTLIDAVVYLLDKVEQWFELAHTQPWASDHISHVSVYFEGYQRISFFGETRKLFDHECWRRYDDGHFDVLLEATFDGKGYVKASMGAWYLLHRETSRIVKQLLDYLPPGSKCEVVSQLRLYGCYMRPPNVGSLVISVDGGSKYVHRSKKSGVVLLAINECMDLAKKISNSEDGDFETVCDQVFCDIMVHEHGHGAIHEGIALHSLSGKPVRPNIDEHAAEVEEPIVEWLEFEAFRWNHKLFKWIMEHANAGCYPNWPYAGALILESLQNQAQLGNEAMRSLIHLYRSGDTNAARARLASWMRLGIQV